MKVGILIRVSTKRQGERGASPQTQKADCLAYAERQGWQIVMVQEDHASGVSFDRPGFCKLAAAAKEGAINRLVVYSLDRFGRGDLLSSLIELGAFEDAGCEIHSVKDGGLVEDSLIRDIRLAINKDFSRQLSDKVSRNMTFRAEQGYWLSVAPFGYQVVPTDDGKGRTLAPDPKTSWAIPELFRMAAEGKSERELVEFARAHGLRTKHAHGKTLSRNAVRWILTNPVYAGKAVWNRWGHGKFVPKGARPESEVVIAEGKHPALVDQDTFDAVQALMDSRRHFGAYAKSEIRMLDGIIWCAQCGNKMRGGCRWSKKQNGRRYPYRYYLCSAKHDRYACSQGYVNAVPLERQVKGLLCGAVFDAIEDDPFIPRLLLEQMQSEFSAGSHRLRSTLEGRLADLRRQRKALLDDYLAGWPQTDIDQKRGELDQAIAAAESELSRLQPDREDEKTRATMRWLEELADQAERDGVYLKVARGDGTAVLGVGMSSASIPIRFEDDVWQEVARTLIHRVEAGNGAVKVEWSARGREIFGQSDARSQLLGTACLASCAATTSAPSWPARSKATQPPTAPGRTPCAGSPCPTTRPRPGRR